MKQISVFGCTRFQNINGNRYLLYKLPFSLPSNAFQQFLLESE